MDKCMFLVCTKMTVCHLVILSFKVNYPSFFMQQKWMIYMAKKGKKQYTNVAVIHILLVCCSHKTTYVMNTLKFNRISLFFMSLNWTLLAYAHFPSRCRNLQMCI